MRVNGEKFGSVSLKLAQNYRTISVAYHEAGHAICGLLHFMQVYDVRVNELRRGVSGNTDFHVLYIDQDYSQLDTKIKDYMINSELLMQFAGLSAEKLFFKDLSGSDNFPLALRLGVEPDFRRAAELIKKYNLAEPGNKRYLFKKKMFRHTTSLLKDFWEDIKLVAYELYGKRKMNYDELRQLLSKKSLNKKFWRKQFKNIDTLFSEDSRIDMATAMLILLR